MVWSSLSRIVQDVIIKRLDSGESPSSLADEYGLYPPSLARKYRKIKQKRIRESGPKPYRQTQTHNIAKTENQETQTVKKQIPIIIKQPKIQTLFDSSNSLFDIKVLGGADALPEERNAWITTKRPITILFYTDTHFGDHDEAACDAFIRVAKTVKHDLVIHGGDALECYGLSKYGKDPRKIFTHSFKQEIRAWRRFSEQLSEVSDAPKMMIFGNHMQRYYDWLMQSGNQSLLDLEEMQLDHIMRLSEFGYAPSVSNIYFDGELNYDFPNPFMMGYHGSLARKGAGNSARSETESRGFINGFGGHTHRLSVSYKRTLESQVVSIEGGTLRTLNTDWMAFSDWSHGCVEIEYSFQDKYVSAYPINILNGRAYLNGARI